MGAPHQREVVRLLQFSAQAAHELVPPDCVEPVLRAIVNNFVTERNSSEVLAVGLNAVRELVARCPLVMTEDLLRDLVEYKTYKDKGVMMASRSLISLFRTICPELLHKRDRGRPTEATLETKRREFGEDDTKDYVAGAEVVALQESEEGDEEDVSDGSSEDESEEEEEEVCKDKDEILTIEEKVKKAREATLGKILTDEDFRRIDAAQLRKQVEGVRKGSKKGKKRTAEDANLDGTLDESNVEGRTELVNLDNIELIHKKKKHDKEARLATVIAGREGREKFGSMKNKKAVGASMTNKQKSKKKNFSMMKHKIKAKGKKSFREKQVSLKKRLLKSQKFK